MTIPVTDIAGFIGMHVAASLLARGESVTGVDNFNGYPEFVHWSGKLTGATLEAPPVSQARFSRYQR